MTILIRGGTHPHLIRPRRRLVVPPIVQGLNIAMGTYIGNGVDDRTLTPLAFNLDEHGFLFIKASTTTGAFTVRSSSMVGDKSGVLMPAGVLAADKIQSFVDGGWTLGISVDVNADLVVYSYVAVSDPTGSFIHCLSYVGDGNDDRNVVGASFTPDIAIIFGDVNDLPVYRTNSEVGDLSSTFTLPAAANQIQALISGGVTVGTHQRVNSLGVTYHAIFMKKTADGIGTARYTGNGADNRNITGFDFDPTFALVHCAATSTQDAVVRFKDNVGDLSQEIDSVRLADGIQAFITAGIQVGSGATIPVNTNTRPYDVIYMKEVAA